MEPSLIHILIVEESGVVALKIKAMLNRLGYMVDYFERPIDALGWLQKTDKKPALILSGIRMAEMNGYAFVRWLRSKPEYVETPILMLAGQSEMEERNLGIQAGANDYISKAISPAELEQRINPLLSRAAMKGALGRTGKTITVFSLRGGVGTSVVSVNLAVALAQMWANPVRLWDMALSGGHCALYMNLKSQKSPAVLAELNDLEVDDHLLAGMSLEHETNVRLMPAPNSVAETELITERTVNLVLPFLQAHAPYVVIDAGNHFTDPVLCLLDRSDIILLVLAPELASILSASDALKIFNSLGIDPQKIRLVVNHTFPRYALPVSKITQLLGNRPIFEIPYDGDTVVQSLHGGKPFVYSAQAAEISGAIAKMAYQLSGEDTLSERKSFTSPLLERVRVTA